MLEENVYQIQAELTVMLEVTKKITSIKLQKLHHIQTESH